MTKIKTTIKPFLTVNDGIRAVQFYIAAFDAVEKKRFELPNHKISSVITIEDAEFYLSDEEPCSGNLSSADNIVRIILETQKADEIFENALKFGATAICQITNEEDWRIGKLKDPFGHIWEIGYPL